MKKEYDFSNAKRGAVLSQAGKTRITIYLDDVIIDRFKGLSERTGRATRLSSMKLCALTSTSPNTP